MGPFIKISSRVHYAVMLLTFIAGQKSRYATSLSLTSKYLKLPHRYLEQIAGELKRAGFIKSYRGSAGGYRLNQKYISMLDVIEAIEGPIKIIFCLDNHQCKIEKKCQNKNLWLELQKELVRSLKRIRIV